MKSVNCKLCGAVKDSLSALRSHFRNEHLSYYQKVQTWLGPDEQSDPYNEPEFSGERVDPDEDPSWISMGNGNYRRGRGTPDY